MAEMIGIDSCVLIYLFEKHPRFSKSAKKILDAVEAGKTPAVFSAIGMIEILAVVKVRGDYALVAEYQNLLSHFPNLNIVGINEGIVDMASDLRARYKICTPDAIHLATAIDLGASKFITNDKNLTKIEGVSVVLL